MRTISGIAASSPVRSWDSRTALPPVTTSTTVPILCALDRWIAEGMSVRETVGSVPTLTITPCSRAWVTESIPWRNALTLAPAKCRKTSPGRKAYYP